MKSVYLEYENPDSKEHVIIFADVQFITVKESGLGLSFFMSDHSVYYSYRGILSIELFSNIQAENERLRIIQGIIRDKREAKKNEKIENIPRKTQFPKEGKNVKWDGEKETNLL